MMADVAAPPGSPVGGAVAGRQQTAAPAGLRTRGGFVPVPISALRLSPERSFDLYARDVRDGRVRYVLFRSQRIPLAPHTLDRLESNHVRFLYIRTPDHRHYTRYLEGHLSAAMAAPGLADRQKVEILYTTAVRLLEEIFAAPEDLGQIRRALPIVEHISRHVLRDGRAFASLTAMNGHDHYTTTHMVNVCGYVCALAVAGGIGAPKALREIALGGLLHDLGKVCVSSRILNSPDKLLAHEWAAIESHPARSLGLASGYLKLSEAVCRMLAEHHERLDGAGYPRGLVGDAIHPYARMCTICDVFDSLTSKRSYRAVMSAGAALDAMAPEVGTQFDAHWFNVWRELVAGNLDARHWPPVARTRSVDTRMPDIGHTPVLGRPRQAERPTRGSARSAEERRRFPRYRFPADLLVHELEPDGARVGAECKARGVDLSRDGVAMMASGPLRPGTCLRIEAPDSANLTRELTGRVVRSAAGADGQWHAAVRFESHPAGATELPCARTLPNGVAPAITSP